MLVVRYSVPAPIFVNPPTLELSNGLPKKIG